MNAKRLNFIKQLLKRGIVVVIQHSKFFFMQSFNFNISTSIMKHLVMSEQYFS